MSICVKLNLGSFIQPPDSQTASEFTESFVCIQAAITSLQRHHFAVQGEPSRMVVHGAEAHIFLACWLEPDCDFVAIEGMISCIVQDFNAMGIQFSIGIDSKAGTIVTVGPETRSTAFTQSKCVQKSHPSHVYAHGIISRQNVPDVFPTSAHSTLIRSGSDTPNHFKFAPEKKIHSVARLPVLFEHHEASLEFSEIPTNNWLKKSQMIRIKASLPFADILAQATAIC